MNTQILAAGALAALALATISPARSQQTALPMQLSAVTQGITAFGHSEVQEMPDIARVTITVTTQSADQANALRQNAERTTAVLTALRGMQIAEKDIQTQSYTIQPQYDDKPSPPLLTGYQVQNSVQATVRDLTKVGLVIDKTAAKGGISEIGDVSFDLSNRVGAQSQALAQAVASAKMKASIMAEAAGVDLGRLLTITEGASTPIYRPVYGMRAMAVSPAPPQTPINDQQILVTADATLVYALGLPTASRPVP